MLVRAQDETGALTWLARLQEASQTMTIDGLNLEKGSSEQFDDEEGLCVT